VGRITRRPSGRLALSSRAPTVFSYTPPPLWGGFESGFADRNGSNPPPTARPQTPGHVLHRTTLASFFGFTYLEETNVFSPRASHQPTFLFIPR
jgi:hypothetical protein